MNEEFSPKDLYEVQVAWDTVMNAIQEIRVEQQWSDKYIVRTLRDIAVSLEEQPG